MPIIICKTAVAVALVVLGGCAVVEKGRLVGAEYAGRAIIAECSFSRVERTKNLAAVNAWLQVEQYVHRAVALDCDGDGASDF